MVSTTYAPLSERFRSLGLAVGLVLAGTSATQAQSVRGVAVERESQEPLSGVLVSLIDTRGDESASTYTNAGGVYQLDGFGPGTYRLRVERIGYESWTSEAFDVGPGQSVARGLEVNVAPVTLDDLRVVVESGCGGGGAELESVWSEVRKALELTRLAEGVEKLPFELRTWERRLDRRMKPIETVSEQTAWRTRGQPFESLEAEQFAEVGYVRRLGTNDFEYFSPDATVLLSESFRSHHCFSLTESPERPGQIGLAFEPLDGSEVPDIDGALWVDRASAELRSLEFEYTDLARAGLPDSDDARGYVEFRRLPSGVWIVSNWRIHMPIQAVDRTSTSLAGYRETGGEVARVELEEGQRLTLAERGSIGGLVVDASSDQPVPGAVVFLEGTATEVTADGAGRFQFDLLPEGVYTLGARDARLPDHPSLVSRREVEVAGGLHANLSLPLETDRMITVLCPEHPGGFVLMGQVVDDLSGEAVPAAQVWLRPEAEDPEGYEADGEGRFMVCGPADTRVVAVMASSLGKLSDTTTVSVQSPIVYQNLQVTRQNYRLAQGDNQRSMLRGTVRAAETGKGLEGARIRVLGSDDIYTTGNGGNFAIEGLMRGRHKVVTEYLGRSSDTVDVDLTNAPMTLAIFTLETEPIEMAELHVEIERTFRNPFIQGFYTRKDRGLGDFITHDDLRHADVVANFRRIPGIDLRSCTPSQTGSARSGLQDTAFNITLRGPSNCYTLDMARGWSLAEAGGCPPIMYLDGHPMSTALGSAFDLTGDNPFSRLQGLSRDMIEGIEVHRNPATAPAQYRTSGARCGVILIWTRRGPAR